MKLNGQMGDELTIDLRGPEEVSRSSTHSLEAR